MRNSPSRQAFQALIPSIAIVASLAGCAGQRPDPRAELDAASALDLAEPIVFRVEAAPLDEPDDLGTSAGTLTRIEAVRLAAMTSPALQSALARVRIAMADSDQTRLLPNPVLSVLLRWGPGKPQIEVSLAQDIVQALQIPTRARAADNRLRSAAADAVTVALDVVEEVQERYATVQALESLVPLIAERRDLLGKLVDTARARLNAGEGTRNDVTTLESQRVELEVELADSRRALREERLRLARLIGRPSSSALWAVEPWSAPNATEVDERVWLAIALKRRPEIQSVTWKLAALGDDMELVRLLPWEGSTAGVDATRDDRWFAGPSVSSPIPVFDTGQARRSRVTAEQIEARHELTLASRKVVEEVRVALQSLRASAENLRRVREELLPLQQTRRDQAEASFRAGQTDVTPLLLAEQDLRLSRAKAIDLERLQSLSLTRLERAIGGAGVVADVQPAPHADDRSTP